MSHHQTDQLNRPNILIVIADQLAAQALSCYGADFANTPLIDQLAADGIRFSQAYTSCPLCAPARASFWTGLLPHQTGVRSNGRNSPNEHVHATTPTIGSLLSDAGYDCHHFGKEHDHGSLHGFTKHPAGWEQFPAPAGMAYNGDSWQDEHTTRQLETFFSAHSSNDPWCVVADMQNPHNICGFTGENNPGCLADLGRPLPELPENFDTSLADRPLPVQYLCCSHRRQFQSRKWDDQQWQQYRAAYRQFIEQCDQQLSRIFKALRQRDDADQTTVLFFADHGDGMGAHQLATKHTTFYEETTSVPMIIMEPGFRLGAHLATL
jgi:choline-sulfatase